MRLATTPTMQSCPPRGPRVVWPALLAAISLSTCGLPKDPESTGEHVRDGVLRVGLVDEPPWAAQGPDGAPRGVEVELVRALAQDLHAELRWNYGGETRLMAELQRFELDLVIGGIVEDSPYSEEVGFTRPYYRGDGRDHVLAAPPGENNWVMTLEQFLRTQEASVPARLARESAP